MTAKSKSSFIESLIKARKQIGSVKKGSKGYNYKYTNLEDLIKHIEEPLFSNGFIILQELISKEDGCDYLRTTLAHTSGDERTSEFRIPSLDKQDAIIEEVHSLIRDKGVRELESLLKNMRKNELQSLGSAITYLKRYSLLALLFLATEDDDAVGAAKMTRNTSNYPKKPSTYINHIQQQDIEYELRDYPDIREQVKETLSIKSFSQMKNADFDRVMGMIKKVKQNRQQVG